ncbi:MAG: DUF1874 domain-containing protein [Anaerolineales bacterium]|nr:DUF1874 domain-containing protein [Anaerolineales bacterium]
MTSYLANAFSLNMLEIGAEGMRVDIQPILPIAIPAEAVSIVGHADMAAILSGILYRKVGVNRESVTLKEGDILFVAQYHGSRLLAGATQLPSDANIEFYRVSIHSK